MAKNAPNEYWQIVPFHGVGPLAFGLSRDEVRRLLGNNYESFRKGPFASNETDAFDSLGIHAYYDINEKLESIDAFGTADVRYHGLNLLNQPIKDVLETLAQIGVKFRYELGSYIFETDGFALYVEGNIVKAVTVFRRGYFD